MFQPPKESQEMRKRGFIILAASLPLWVTNAFLWHYYKLWVKQVLADWGPDVLGEPYFFHPANIACILVTLVALAFLLFDFLRWLRARHHPRA
jgi:hypothetical protein